MNAFSPLLPGLALALTLGVSAHYAGPLIGIDGVSLALLVGLLIGRLPWPAATTAGVKFSEKRFLEAAVALLGLTVQLGALASMGDGFLLGTLSLLTALVAGPVLAKLLGQSPALGALLGIGNGVCGSSAIAATAPLLTEDPDDVALSVGVVNLLGFVGIALVLSVGKALGLDDLETATVAGAGLQAVGHVAAAGYSLSESAGDLAITIKLGRVAMLVPLVLVLSFWRGKRQAGSLPVPAYLLIFAALAAVGSLVSLPFELLAAAKLAAKILLATALGAIGLRLDPRALVRRGPRALAVGAGVFACQLALLFGYFLLR